MALYEMKYEDGMKITLTKGNIKIGKGIWSFSTLPGNDYISTTTKGQLTCVKGTCGDCAKDCSKHCYAIKSLKCHHNSITPVWTRNTLIMRHSLQDGFDQIINACKTKKISVLRFHVSGEIESYDYLCHMVRLAKACPETIVSFYTKQFAYIKRWITENGEFPKNLICNMSAWKDNIKGYENLPGCNYFYWDDGDDESLNGMFACPAVERKPGAKIGHETGVTCDKCMRCYKARGTKTRVYNH